MDVALAERRTAAAFITRLAAPGVPLTGSKCRGRLAFASSCSSLFVALPIA
jgi:hypothetical protein